MKSNILIKRSEINAPAERLFEWHERQGAIERLSPPWTPVTVIHQLGGIKKGARVRLRVHNGIFPMIWESVHTKYVKNSLFSDRQVRGPFSSWKHTHLFTPLNQGSTMVEDRVEYALPSLGQLFSAHVREELEKMFDYRHRVLKLAMEQSLFVSKKLTILIAGASGLIGRELTAFFSTAGHRVIRLVRRPPSPGQDEIEWNPLTGDLNLEDAGKIDAVINLCGENIATGRWTGKKKKKIMESRLLTTGLLAKKITSLDSRPALFISASAIGFYGDRQDQIMDETSSHGEDYISRVCRKWEDAAAPAADAGIRTVTLRIGIVLSCAGGALAKMLLPFKLGLGADVGSGRQYMSWVSMDDVTGAFDHILQHQEIHGPVNLVSPNPVTNSEFTRTLAGVLSRPAPFNIPAGIVYKAGGEMGRELMLSSLRVMPKKLLDSNFRFRLETLEKTLRHVTGKAL